MTVCIPMSPCRERSLRTTEGSRLEATAYGVRKFRKSFGGSVATSRVRGCHYFSETSSWTLPCLVCSTTLLIYNLQIPQPWAILIRPNSSPRMAQCWRGVTQRVVVTHALCRCAWKASWLHSKLTPHQSACLQEVHNALHGHGFRFFRLFAQFCTGSIVDIFSTHTAFAALKDDGRA